MKRKILYILTTAVIATTAFSVGKNFTVQPAQTETITPEMPEISHLTVTEYGLQIDFADNTGVWIESVDLEKAGLIDTENIVDWNTDGTELAVITENDYEWYAYKSADIYQNRAFIPAEK